MPLRCLEETRFHRSPRAKQPGSVHPAPPLFPVSPSTAGGQQRPCHLCFSVYSLASCTLASSDQGRVFPPTRPLPAKGRVAKSENRVKHGVREGPAFGVDIKEQEPRMLRHVLWGMLIFSSLIYITSLSIVPYQCPFWI